MGKFSLFLSTSYFMYTVYTAFYVSFSTFGVGSAVLLVVYKRRVTSSFLLKQHSLEAPKEGCFWHAMEPSASI